MRYTFRIAIVLSACAAAVALAALHLLSDGPEGPGPPAALQAPATGDA